MKLYLYLFFSFTSLVFSAQVGIGTNTPDISSILEVQATDRGILFPRMTTVQRTSISNPAAGLHVFDISSNSLWFYNGSFWVNYATQAKYGDVKSGIHTQDHEGWVLLDGRAINTLTPSQQAVVASLGWVGNIPNASNAYLVQNGAALGAVSGSNTVTLTQGNLPNVNFTGNTSNAGTHSHTTDPVAFNSGNAGGHNHSTDPAGFWSNNNGSHQHNIWHNNDDFNEWGGGNASLSDDGGGWYTRQTDAAGDHSHWIDVPPTASSTDGAHVHSIDVPSTASSSAPDHSHTVSVASGGSATPVNIAPQSLTVNMFIYIGQ